MKNYQLAIISGFMMCFAWFSWSTPFFLFFAFVPLFIAMYNVFYDNSKHKYLQVFYLSYITFFIWIISAAYWLYNASFASLILPVVVNAFIMSMLMLLTFFALKRKGWSVALLFFISIWISFEKFQHEWEFSWTSMTLGNGFGFFVNLVQWYEFTGVLGGSLWVLLSNVLVFVLWKRYKQKNLVKPMFKNFILPVSVIIIPMIASALILYSYKMPQKKLKIAVVQPNLDPYSEKFNMSDIQMIEHQIQMIDSTKDMGIKLYLSPETSLPQSKAFDSFQSNDKILYLKKYLDSTSRAAFLLGATFVKYYEASEQRPTTTANFSKYNYWYDVYNSAIFIGCDKIELYNKSKLVPGVEIFPYRNILEPLIGDLMMDFGGMSGSHVTQKERSVFNTCNDSLKIAPIICYESAYGEFLSTYVKNGANLFCVITNDGWWGNTEGHKQLLGLSRLRAIESRRSIARSANTGISAFINPLGKVTEAVEYDKKAVAVSDVVINDAEPTIYNVYGDYLARYAFFMFCMVSVFVLVPKKNKQ